MNAVILWVETITPTLTVREVAGGPGLPARNTQLGYTPAVNDPVLAVFARGAYRIIGPA